MDLKAIDHLVGENVLHWEWREKLNSWVTKKNETDVYPFIVADGDFSPTTKIADAWVVLQNVCKEGEIRCIMDVNGSNQTEVTFKNQMGGYVDAYGTAERAEVAICLAVLELVGITLVEC